MTSKTQRVISFILALFFFGSTVGAAFYYILTAKNQDEQNQLIQEAVKQAQNQPSQTPQPTNQEGNKLQGKQLSNFEPTANIPGLQSIDMVPGDGDVVKPGDTVTVHYTGAVAKDGIIFQSSLDGGQPVSFPLNGVIKGWTDGIPGMKVGGTRRLLIPASLAYAANPPAGSGIPANADLVFDVQLIKIGQ